MAICPTRTARESPSVAQGSDEPSMRRADDREIGVGVVADQIGAHRTAVGHHDRHGPRLFDDVAVGEDQSVGREEHARTAAARDLDLDHRGPTVSTAWMTAEE